MNHPNTDEDVPVRGYTDYAGLREDKHVTKDEEQVGTLRQVHVILRDKARELDSWRAFNCTDTDLKLKQHIHAHKMAYDIVSPCLDLVEQALALVDEQFRQRNK